MINFDELIHDIENLIDLPLVDVKNSNEIYMIKNIDHLKKKIYLSSEGKKRLLARNFKDLELVLKELTRTNFCCVSDILKTTDVNIMQIENIFLNLPYINYFRLDGVIYLVLRNSLNHPYGTVEELPLKEQRSAKKVISNFRQLQYNQFSSSLLNSISSLDREIEKIHVLAPGLLADTNLRELLSDFKNMSALINSTTLSIDKNDEEQSLPEIVENDDFDMSDLVDMSYITGIEGDVTSSDDDNSGDEDSEDEDEVAILRVPNIRRTTPSFALLYERLLYDEIEIQPDYQRKDRIWSDDKKSKLIESILMGLPLPIFYFGERKDDTWVIIDGLQRITTVQDFMQNKFPLKLEKGSSVYDANGLLFKDFNRTYTRLLREFEITAYVIDIIDSSSNKFITELFHRINTYGVKLSDQEIRSAINFGSSVYYLKFLASTKIFTSATTNTVNTKRQKDLELCLGALAFMIFGYKSYKKNRYDDFLTEAMRWINDQPFRKSTVNDIVTYISESSIIIELTKRFESSLKFCQEIFGKDAFKKVRNSSKKDPISKPLFEMFVSLFSNLTEEQQDLIRRNKSDFLMAFYEAINKDVDFYATWNSQPYIEAQRGFNYSISSSTGKRVTILYRFEAIIKMINITTGCEISLSPIVVSKNHD